MVSVLDTARRLGLVALGATLVAFNLRTFVAAGGLLPGGFTGLILLVQEICLRYFDLNVPFSILLYATNAVPAVICFCFVGKKFTLYSVLAVALNGIMFDLIPPSLVSIIDTNDMVLSSVFGGILTAVAVVLCLHADASLGGTDFIAIYISEKYRKDAWNYIFMGNCVILALAGFLFSIDKALYSIIFQFTTTSVISFLYRAYQQKTLLIVTDLPQEVSGLIWEKTRHGATAITGKGMYNAAERSILYSVVYSNEAAPLINAIRAVDPHAFINVIKTEQVNGRFFKKPKD